ncbi:hypothetical protein GCM10009718_33150 [Isoptericola halotolerans]|uniref:Uncharacterized protein n=1 Tax=Isoptericola halotolerans TaxID=300560 RepID=A0ABX2A958_9MICO|nr:hypothetical protein [Isoptericola halotolerans]NOV98203.1 hypothetical protein [Isoptericola halotolerans]
MIDLENIGPADIGKAFRVTHRLGAVEGPLTHVEWDTGAVEDSVACEATPRYVAGATTVRLTIGGQRFTFEQTGHGYRGPGIERVGA